MKWNEDDSNGTTSLVCTAITGSLHNLWCGLLFYLFHRQMREACQLGKTISSHTFIIYPNGFLLGIGMAQIQLKMKKHLHNSLRALFLSLAVLLSLPMLAEKVEIDGIWYNLESEGKQAEVTYKGNYSYEYTEYSGVVVIPASVVYNGTTYSVTSIGDWACWGSDLTSVTIPNSVTSIGYRAFSASYGLTSVTIGNSVKSIGDYAFIGCDGLTSVTIPNSVTSIGSAAFSGCDGLTSVTIPNSVTSIGANAFEGCSGLTSVTIGSGVTSIGERAFVGCSGLTSVTIPNSVTSIEGWAFNGCTGLTSVTIGSGVTSIGEYAFSYCFKLLDVHCYAEEVPSTESSTFFNSPIASATLHVPNASIESYETTSPWRSFGKIVGLSNEYSLTVSSVGYATLYLDFNAKIPGGVKAYVAKEVVDSRLKMELVEGVLPANTGVIIMAEEGTYAFVESDETPAVIEKNLLKGTVEKTEITAEANTSYYVLSAPDGVMAMYLALLTENKFWNNAHKAYLPISNGDLGIFDDEVDSSVEQLSRRLVFDFGDETGIDEVKTENANVKTAVYDLSGRRIQNAQKGIYIQNGKLMVK